MIHRGELVHKRIKEFGPSYSFIYKRLGIDQDTLKRWLALPELDYTYIARIGVPLRWEFSTDFPEMKGKIYLYPDGTPIIACKQSVSYCNPLINEMMKEIKQIKIILSEDKERKNLTGSQ